MASIDVGIHHDPKRIRSKRFTASSMPFSTLEFGAGGDDKVVVFVCTRRVIDALQAALDEIRADMDAAEQAAIKAAQTSSDQVPTVMADWPAGPPGELMEIHGK